jgi:signal transduction histidine kinase/ActR/RegA family two-component response regulator
MPTSTRTTEVARGGSDSRVEAILCDQVRLLYANTNVSVVVTVVSATVLARLQSGYISAGVILAWWVYMIVLSALRYELGRRYQRALPDPGNVFGWSKAASAGAGLAGAGWGAAGILLYPPFDVAHQDFLVFVIGGMMLGAAFILAARPEAFLAFLIPTGTVPALRFIFHGDQTHLAMGLLAMVFTVAVVVTTGRIYQTIESLLKLQLDNRELVDDLRAARDHAEALNEELERRVEERTAELNHSNEQLRSEIQQREQMEEEVLRGRKLESLGVLAGGIAHDFNNFLTVIQGNIELARNALSPADAARAILDRSTMACRRAAFLASQLLTFAKGGVPVRRVASIRSLVVDAVHMVRAGTPVSVTVDIAEDLKCAEVDPGQISQVLNNILLNAREAMPEGGVIEVRARNDEADEPGTASRVRISIRDHGPGIPEAVLPRVFDPYFTTKPGATGLGLATAHSIIAKHGGHISVESRPGEGTLIDIDLPASVERAEPQAAVESSAGCGGERILVMDDEEALRNLLQAVLGNLDYHVQLARDGAEAIALYREAERAGMPFDAVILDLTVSGGMGGMEAAARLKEIDPSARLIVSSGYSDSPVMSDFARLGFDGVIPKPWTAAYVAEVLRRVLAVRPERKPTH